MASAEQTVDLIFLLSEAARSLEGDMAAALAEIGTTPRSYCVLSKAMEGEHTQIELAKLAALDKTTMVVALDELERQGLAERRPSPKDRRARVIAVTPAGAEVVARGRQVVEDLYGGVLSSLPEEQREPFVAALHRIVSDRPPARAGSRRRRGSPGSI